MNNKLKATPAMISTVKSLPRSERAAAKRVAEVTFSRFYAKLSKYAAEDGMTSDDVYQSAGDAAAAEVAFQFA